jgi:hypothetical protein
MALSWSGRRKVLYTGAVGIIALVALFFIWNIFFNIPGSCFDGIQNDGETGIDCGGSCALLCPDAARAPIVLWSRAFPSTHGGSTYTAAAYIQNANPGAGAKNVSYTFALFDASNSLIMTRTGTADLPPVQTVPIIETNINAGTRAVARTLFSFSNLPVWNKVPAGQIPPFSIADQNLSADGSRLSATVTNDSFSTAAEVTIAAVLFDQNGAALAASKSTIGALAGKSSQAVVFTWSGGVPGVARAEITILPSF